MDIKQEILDAIQASVEQNRTVELPEGITLGHVCLVRGYEDDDDETAWGTTQTGDEWRVRFADIPFRELETLKSRAIVNDDHELLRTIEKAREGNPAAETLCRAAVWGKKEPKNVSNRPTR